MLLVSLYLSDGSLTYCVLFGLFLVYLCFVMNLIPLIIIYNTRDQGSAIIEGDDDHELVEPDVLVERIVDVEDTKGQKAHFYSREFGMHLKQF